MTTLKKIVSALACSLFIFRHISKSLSLEVHPTYRFIGLPAFSCLQHFRLPHIFPVNNFVRKALVITTYVRFRILLA